MTIHASLDELRARGGEAAAAEGRLTRHLLSCTACRENAAWIDAVQGTASLLGPVPAPAGAWERIAARVAAGERVLLPTGADPVVRGRRISLGSLARVAALVLLVAGAVSAAVPGSPVRRWIDRAVARNEATTRALPAPPPTRASSATADPPAEARLLVPPHEGAVAISLEAPGPELRVRVRLIEAGDVEMRATGAAAGARFRSGPGRLTIAGAGSGTIYVTVPRAVRRLTLSLDGRVLLEKDRAQLRVLTPDADTVGSEIVLAPGLSEEPRP